MQTRTQQLPEEMGNDAIQRELQKHERMLQRRRNRCGNNLSAVAARQAIVVQHQAELATLQPKRGDTRGDSRVWHDYCLPLEPPT